ncbi:MAG: TIGR01777 family oxidoreductase [Bacteroidetes bacterium]|nr:TIGR01777 family oxidoreductase [Bacteroidota bacterium]
MVIAVSGASGFIGKTLVRILQQKDWTVRIINRDSFSLPDHDFLIQKIEGADVVINLAGAPVAKKWTPDYMKEIIASRVTTARKISDAINLAERKPALLISTSAIGIYDSKETHAETSLSLANNFLAKVCMEWEREARRAEIKTRVVIFRLGMVLGNDGGALEKMQRLFRIGLGGKLGSGKQAVSFIHIHDLMNAFIFAIENENLRGIVNAVSPYPSNNAEFTDILGKVFNQPTWIAVPAFILKKLYGEGAQALLDGQKVIPEKLLNAGFKFNFPTIQNALVNLFS